LFGGIPGKIRDLWITGLVVPLISREAFAEFEKVLRYPKFRLTDDEVRILVEEELLAYAEVVVITADVSGACRDPHDDKFLALAVSGEAAFMVTGDRDLLVLQSFRKTRIVTVSEFMTLMSGR